MADGFPKPFGKYVLVRQIATGGMAEVFLARQTGPAGFEKECVIKRILPGLAADEQFVQMFLDEARIAARLSHPNIVQIFNLGQAGKDYYIAMEHVPGVDMSQILAACEARGQRLPLPIALRILASVADGLEHAHRATDGRGHPLGVVHRDVTPSNIIVSVDGVAKVLDFGIAKAAAKQWRTEVGVIKGKIPYMSPEQVQGEPLDARSDVFSLGTIIYEATTGQKPFDGENPAELGIKILHDEPLAPELLVDDYPEALKTIVLSALVKRRDDRCPSAAKLHRDLESFLVASGTTTTSYDVAQCIAELFPNLLKRNSADDATRAPHPGTDPTMPHLPAELGTGERRTGFTTAALLGVSGPSGPITGDLPLAELAAASEREREPAQARVMPVVIVLVLMVAAGFWWLRGAQTAVVTPSPAPSLAPVSAPPHPKTVRASTAPSPSLAVAAPSPSATPAATLAASAAPSPGTVKLAHDESHPAREPERPVRARPERTAKRPQKRPPHHTAKPAAHDAEPAGERALPRLPGPPPADDEAASE